VKLRRRISASWILPLLLLLTLPAVVQAQGVNHYTNSYGTWIYSPTNGPTTLVTYWGTNAVVVIPDTINGLPVVNISQSAFFNNHSLIKLTIPDSVTNIGVHAFYWCFNLRNVSIGTNVTNVEDEAFQGCESLTSITLPDSVASIGHLVFGGCNSLTNIIIGSGLTNITFYSPPEPAFPSCSSLTAIIVDTNNPAFSSVDGVLFNKSQTTLIQYPQSKNTTVTSYTVPNGVTNIGPSALASCTNLCSMIIPASVASIGSYGLACFTPSNTSCTSRASVYFQGNHPTLGASYWFGDPGPGWPIVYYLPGTTGWDHSPDFKLWNPQPQAAGVRTNKFGFTITGTTNIPVVVEAAANLASASWTPLQPCTLTNGSIYFSDPQWTNYPARFYRLRSP
jgi:hypothetical protein